VDGRQAVRLRQDSEVRRKNQHEYWNHLSGYSVLSTSKLPAVKTSKLLTSKCRQPNCRLLKVDISYCPTLT
jgi:hypothetical protein